VNHRLRKHLLSVLNACGTYVMPERLLVEDSAPVWTATEVQSELRRMEVDGLAVPGRGALGDLSWKLTAAGLAVCAEEKL
jgi:hypothetical protein